MKNTHFLFIILFINCLNLFGQEIDFVTKGQNLIEQNKLDQAIVYFTSNFEKAENDDQKIFMLFGLADAYKLKIEYYKANEYYLKAFDLIKKKNDIQLKFLYHVKMAEFFRKRPLYADAAKEIDIAGDILRKNKIKDIYLVKYYSRKAAIIAESFTNKDSTLFYCFKTLEIAKKLNNKDNIFTAQLEIAGVYEYKKDLKKAIPYLEEIIQFAKQNNLIQQQADASLNYMRVLIQDKQYEKALKSALQSADFAKKNKLYLNELYCYNSIYDLYYKLNDTENAYKSLKTRLELTDKYNILRNEEMLLNFEAKYKFNQNQNEIKIKNKELEANKVNFFITIFILVIVLFVAFLILYFLKKSKKTNGQLQFLLDQNDFLLSEANHRINNNLQLIIVLINDEIAKSTKKSNLKAKRILLKVDSVATLHKHLYKTKDKKNVDVQKYLTDIQTNIQNGFVNNDIQMNFTVQSFDVEVDLAMYLGLLLTELIINTLKHAFSDQAEKIIDFKLETGDNFFVFTYSDNGNGSKKEITLKLIDQLCQQIKVKYDLDTDQKFFFTFKKTI